jgi:hypothetical protein
MRRGHRAGVSSESGGEERALGWILGEPEGALVRGACLIGPAEGAQQLRPRRVVQVVAVELFGDTVDLDVGLNSSP